MVVDLGVDWSAAYEEHAGAVNRLARLIVGSAEDAADVTQVTFERAVAREQRYERSRPLRPWLLGIAGHEALGFARRRRRFSWVPLIGSAPAYAVRETSPVWDAVASLPAGHRAVIALFYIHGYSTQEVATILDLPAGTVGSRLHTARRRLRDMLVNDEARQEART
jgi:RNA polymerase sigma-70 factor (ECF subfamily)